MSQGARQSSTTEGSEFIIFWFLSNEEIRTCGSGAGAEVDRSGFVGLPGSHRESGSWRDRLVGAAKREVAVWALR